MAEGKKASLIVLGGPLAGTRCVLPDTGVVRVGSAEDSTLQIDLPGVSPLHARVVVEPGRVLVQDAGAERPLHVNDNPVEAAGTVLRNGDIIWLGMPGDADVVMLQCVLPRKQVEAAHSPEVTLAAVPMPVELPARAAPTPEIETTALRVPPAVASAPEPEPLPSEDELVFVDDSVPASVEVQPITVDQVEVVEEAPPESTAHVVVSDFEKAVFVEPDVRQPVEPQEFEPEPTLVSADAPAFEDAVDESVEEAATIAATAAYIDPDIDAPTVALPPPVVVAPAPAAPEKPPAAPPAPPHPERSYAGAAPVRRSPGASSPNVSQSLRTPQPPGVSQAVRSQAHAPQATHPPHVSHARHAPPRRSSGGSRTALLAVGGVGVLAVLGVGGFFAWRAFVARPTPAPAPSATPMALAQPTPAALPTAEMPAATPTNEAPVPEFSPTPSAPPLAAPSPTPSPRATASPSPRATPSPSPRTTPAPGRPPGSTTPAVTSPTGPSPAQQAAQAQSFVDQAEAALAARQYDAAVGHADGALRLEPGNARAGAVRAEAVRRRDLAHRRFVAGQTIVETQSKGGGIAGFDTGGADLRKAPDFQGRIEFEMSPGSGLEAGAAWTLRVFVVNDGKKPIRVLSLSIATRVNGSGSAANAVPRTREISPQQRALVAETNGAWREGTTAWASEVSVTANKGDSLRNTLTWR